MFGFNYHSEETLNEKCIQALVSLNLLNPDHRFIGGNEIYASVEKPCFDKLTAESRPHLNGNHREGSVGLSLAHTYVQNGDVCSCPFMEFLLVPHSDGRIAQVIPISFEQSIPPLNAHVIGYGEDGVCCIKSESKLIELHEFLAQWLTNLVDQGFIFSFKNLSN